MNRLTVNNVILIVVLVIVSLIFLFMIRQFIMVVLLAGIFSGMMQPLHRRFLHWLNGRANLSAALSLILISLIIFIPLLTLIGIVVGQAISIGNSVRPWISEQLQRPTTFDELLQPLPFYDYLSEHQSAILQKAGELVSGASSFLVDSLSNVTMSTVNFLFMFFVLLYTMFFFLKEGHTILNKILFYLPLTDTDERRMLEKFTSVTRATIKGTLVIGLLQGGMAGLAFWVVGIRGALFWGTVMTVLSIVPVVGSALVWFPAVIILAATGHIGKAIGLWAFCGLLVGSVDNILRPRLVGKDTKMHELLIFFSTMGGIAMFGMAGFIIGPIIAALFVTVWDIYGKTFYEYLPAVATQPTGENQIDGHKEQSENDNGAEKET